MVNFSDLEMEMIQEAWMQGRIYGANDEKELPALANKKMVNACLSIKIKALQKQKKKSAKKSKPKSKDQTGMDLMNNIENQFSVG